jgi:hypothetical protein
MFKKSRGTRALQVAGSVALCTFAIASQATPISLTGSCDLSSILPGQGKCDISFSLSDDFTTPSTARKAFVKIDSFIVAQFVNDIDNPVDFAVTRIFGRTTVACGVNHTVTAYVAPVGIATPYVKVGNLPPILCPPAP